MIEIVEFYPLEKDEQKDSMVGHLRIKLLDSGIHILGIVVTKRKDAWFFLLPGQSGIHHETRERIRYPFICFEDRDKHKLLMETLREKGKAFIEARLADSENPLIFPEKRQSRPRNTRPLTNQNKPIMEPIKKSETRVFSTKASSTPKKVFVDLPPRKSAHKKAAPNPFRNSRY